MTNPVRWAGRKLAIADEHVREAVELRRQARELLELRAKIPPIAELAMRWNVSQQTARNYLYGRSLPKQFAAAYDDNA